MTAQKQPEKCWNCGATKEEHIKDRLILKPAWANYNLEGIAVCRIFKGSKLAKRMGWE